MPVRCRVGIETTRITNNIRLGNSVTAITAAYTDKALQVYTTSPSTNASTAFEPVLFNTVQTGAGAIPVGLRVNLESNVKLGAWANAIYASMDLKTSGGTAGAACVVCSEITMGAGATEGTFGIYEAEVNCPTSWTGAGAVNFLYFNTYGATKANFDTYGNFLWLTGVTAGASKFLSLTSQTLRCYVNTATRYLVLSQTQDGIGLGTSGTPQVVTYDGAKPFSLYTTCASTNASTSYEPFYVYTTLTGVGQVGGRGKFTTYCNVAAGGWVNALKAEMTFGSSGRCSGLASSINCEMTLPNATLTGGAFYPVEIELNPGASTVMGGITGARTGFIFMSVNTNTGDFLDKGYIFEFQGLGTAASSHIFQANTDQPTHALRISIDKVAYYMLLTSADNGSE